MRTHLLWHLEQLNLELAPQREGGVVAERLQRVALVLYVLSNVVHIHRALDVSDVALVLRLLLGRGLPRGRSLRARHLADPASSHLSKESTEERRKWDRAPLASRAFSSSLSGLLSTTLAVSHARCWLSPGGGVGVPVLVFPPFLRSCRLRREKKIGATVILGEEGKSREKREISGV